MADSMDAARYTVDGDHWHHNDRSNFRPAMKTGTGYSEVESIRINDTTFSGKIIRSVQVEQTRDPLGGSRIDLRISTTIHGAGGLRKMLSEAGHRAMVLIITHPNGSQTVCREICVMEMKMDVRVGFSAELLSRSLPSELPASYGAARNKSDIEKREPLQIIIDDQLIPREHCSAVWYKATASGIYRTTVEVAEQYVESSKFSMGDVATIKLRYPDVELTFLSIEGIDIDDHNTEKRMFRFTHRAKLISERKVKTQKPELF